MIQIEDTKGWICLYRNIQDSWVWQDDTFSKGQAWIDLLLMVNYEDKKVLFNAQLIEVKRGQRITSIRQLAERWKWSRKKVTAFLDLLESDKMIVKASDTKKTLITIENYNKYQDVKTTKEPQKSQQSTSKEPQKHTNNNDKQLINNDNNIGGKPKRFIPPTLEEVEAYCLKRNNNIDAQRWIDFYSSKGWYVGKNKMTDWKAAVRTWENNSSPKNTGQKMSSADELQLMILRGEFKDD